MRRVQGAWVAGAVGAHLGVEQVVHQIVGDMRQGDTKQGEDEPAPVQTRLPDRQQRRHQAGYQGHRQHRRPGDHEPARDCVDRPVRRRVGGADGVRPGRQPGARLDLRHPRIVCLTSMNERRPSDTGNSRESQFVSSAVEGRHLDTDGGVLLRCGQHVAVLTGRPICSKNRPSRAVVTMRSIAGSFDIWMKTRSHYVQGEQDHRDDRDDHQ